MSWAREELATLDLGDARLVKRAVLLAERLAQKPGASGARVVQVLSPKLWLVDMPALAFHAHESLAGL